MENDVINDGTDAFDARLALLQRQGAPRSEVDAAIAVYERLKTAQAICQALMPAGFSEAAPLAVLAALGTAVQSGQASSVGE